MRVLHLPMACPVDKSMVMRGIRLFGADPAVPLTVVGNPSSPGLTKTRFSMYEAYQTFRQHSLVPTARPLLHLLETPGVTSTEHLGFSYGARTDRKSVVEGRSGSVRVDLGGRSIHKKKTH